jgi:hypothetical protein
MQLPAGPNMKDGGMKYGGMKYEDVKATVKRFLSRKKPLETC